jgi:vacuolar-type H+-ATPase subunit H
MERDQIAEYLDQLRSSLLTSRRRAQLILDEAEDHLRESAAAGLAAGRTEAEAQRAAIASFGSVRAVVRAHAAARPWRAAAVLANVVLAAWKLAAVYLLAVFATGLVWHLLSGSIDRLMGLTALPDGVQICRRCSVARMGLALTSGLHPTSPVWLAAGLAGAALIGVFALIRRWQQRGGRVRPLLPGSDSPMAGAVFFFALAAWLVWGWARSDVPWWALPDARVARIAAMGTVVGYLVALGRTLLRRQRGELASA